MNSIPRKRPLVVASIASSPETIRDMKRAWLRQTQQRRKSLYLRRIRRTLLLVIPSVMYITFCLLQYYQFQVISTSTNTKGILKLSRSQHPTSSSAALTASWDSIENNRHLVFELPSRLECPPWTKKNESWVTSLPQKSPIPPIWVPSYPGSGSELFRDLIQAWTHLPAYDVYFEEICQGGITCKTHWPALPGRDPRALMQQQEQNKQQQPYHFDTTTAFLLLRHPAAALPSYRNFLYEVNHHIPDHSQQAPEADWIEWRDRRFHRDLQRWVNMIRTWYGINNDTDSDKNHSSHSVDVPPRVTLLIPYEDLVQSPAIVERIHAQLAQKLNRTSDDAPPLTLNLTDMKCAWQHYVVDRPGKKRITHGYKPTFTRSQYQQMRDALVQLQMQFPHNSEPELVTWLHHYQRDVERKLSKFA